jgi:hypothetical protein
LKLYTASQLLQTQEVRLEKLKYAAKVLRDTGKPISKASLCEVAHIDTLTVDKDKELETCVKDLVEAYRKEREEKLLVKVRLSVSLLRAEGKKVTLNAIGAMVELDSPNLKRYKSIFDYLNTLPELPSPLTPPPDWAKS